MADNDDFKFDDDVTFPESDLSSAFSDGEQAAEPEDAGVPDYPMTVKKSGGGRTRMLLLLLLLVVAGGGGYYFLMMDEPAPPPPVKKAAVKPAPKPVAAPAPVPVQPAASQATVSPPPAAPAAVPAPATAAAKPAAVTVAVPPPPAPVAVAAPVPAPAKPAPVPAPVAVAAPPAPTTAPPVAAAPAVKATPKPAGPAVTGGPWLVEAGTFVNPKALKSVEQKIRRLGYEPKVSSAKRTVHMTRLRLGTFPADEVKEALAYARGVAPEAFSLRNGDQYTVYAGTFTSQENIRQMTDRLVSEGVKVEEEPIEVPRTISLVRFGGFDSETAAGKAANLARKAGILAEVVKPR